MKETITLDTSKCESTVGNARIAPLRRGERGNVQLVVFVRRNSRPYNLTGMTADLVWKAADGKLVGPVPMEVTDPATGTVSCTLPDACYSTVGTARAYVELRRGAELVDTTDELGVKVLDCIDADAEQAEEYKPLIAEVREAVASAKRSAEGAEAAKDAANKAAEAAIDSAASANNAADEARAAVSAYTEIIKQNKKRITSLEGTVSKQGKQIANLQGIAATEETDSTEAYTKAVPAGAQKWASLDKVGGKTLVWNQIRDKYQSGNINGVTVSQNNNGGVNMVGTVSDSPYGQQTFTQPIKLKRDGRKYAIVLNKATGYKFGVSGYATTGNENDSVCLWRNTSGGTWVGLIYLLAPNGTIMNVVNLQAYLVDLTQMFGAGNEPTSLDDQRIDMIRRIAEAHPEYNPGELMSAEVVEVESKGTFPIPAEVREMCPGYGWSAGTVCNEIDFERKVYVQRVGSVDLGTLDWVMYTIADASSLFRASVPGAIFARYEYLKEPNAICAAYTSKSNIERANKTISRANINAPMYDIIDNSYSNAAAFKEAMAGVQLYYELAEPIEIDLSGVLSDDNFIEVEAGGTITFKQASTQLPVPSSVTYQISTKEAIANA